MQVASAFPVKQPMAVAVASAVPAGGESEHCIYQQRAHAASSAASESKEMDWPFQFLD